MSNAKELLCPYCDVPSTILEWDKETALHYQSEMNFLISAGDANMAYGNYCCPSCSHIVDGGELEAYQEYVAEMARIHGEEDRLSMQEAEEAKRNERVPVKRYVLFGFYNYYPGGGANDMCCSFDDPDDIELGAEHLNADVYQVLDLYTMKFEDRDIGTRGRRDEDTLIRIKMFAEEFTSKE